MRCFYQHDGAPHHNSHLVNNLLIQMFGDRHISNNGPYLWPPRSPDITPLDFFLWEYIKNNVFKTTPTSKDDCQFKVRQAIDQLSPEQIRRASKNEVERRVLKYLECRCMHFQQQKK